MLSQRVELSQRAMMSGAGKGGGAVPWNQRGLHVALSSSTRSPRLPSSSSSRLRNTSTLVWWTPTEILCLNHGVRMQLPISTLRALLGRDGPRSTSPTLGALGGAELMAGPVWRVVGGNQGEPLV